MKVRDEICVCVCLYCCFISCLLRRKVLIPFCLLWTVWISSDFVVLFSWWVLFCVIWSVSKEGGEETECFFNTSYRMKLNVSKKRLFWWIPVLWFVRSFYPLGTVILSVFVFEKKKKNERFVKQWNSMTYICNCWWFG